MTNAPSAPSPQRRLDSGDFFRNLRQKAGLSQPKAAAAIGVTQSSVCRWETGETVPNELRLPIIARAYGVDPAYLIGRMAEFAA